MEKVYQLRGTRVARTKAIPMTTKYIILFNKSKNAVVYQSFQGLYKQTYDRDRTIILDEIFLALFENWNDVSRFPFHRQGARLE